MKIFKICLLAVVFLCAALLFAQTSTSEQSIKLIKPQKPYRVWYQPGLLEKCPQLYSYMNLDAGGTVKPLFGFKHNIATLNWSYGPNHPKDITFQYFVSVLAPDRKIQQPDQGEFKGKTFISAGIAVDEWIRGHSKDKIDAAVKGLRLAKKKYPDRFIAVWFVFPDQTLFDLAKEGTVDLLIYEGYTFRQSPYPVQKDDKIWPIHIAFCEQAKKAGVLDKMIFSFGHIIGGAKARDGTVLDAKLLEKRIREIKHRYPEMPGVAFYQANSLDTPENRKLIEMCNRLSGELWPDKKESKPKTKDAD